MARVWPVTVLLIHTCLVSLFSTTTCLNWKFLFFEETWFGSIVVLQWISLVSIELGKYTKDEQSSFTNIKNYEVALLTFNIRSLVAIVHVSTYNVVYWPKRIVSKNQKYLFAKKNQKNLSRSFSFSVGAGGS